MPFYSLVLVYIQHYLHSSSRGMLILRGYVFFVSNFWHPWLWREVGVSDSAFVQAQLYSVRRHHLNEGVPPRSCYLSLCSQRGCCSLCPLLSFVLVSFLCGLKYINKCVFCIGHLLLQSWFWDGNPTSVPANPYSVWRYHWCYIHKFPPFRAT